MSESSAWDAGGDSSINGARRDRTNFQIALRTARTVGVAVGIVMERLHLSEHEAWQVVVYTGQRSHRTTLDIATDLIETGELPPHP